MIVPSITNPFFTLLTESIEHQLQERGKQLFLCDSRQDPVVESQRMESLISRQVDGVIISPCHESESRNTVLTAARSVRVVQLDRRVTGTRQTGSVWTTRRHADSSWST